VIQLRPRVASGCRQLIEAGEGGWAIPLLLIELARNGLREVHPRLLSGHCRKRLAPLRPAKPITTRLTAQTGEEPTPCALSRSSSATTRLHRRSGVAFDPRFHE